MQSNRASNANQRAVFRRQACGARSVAPRMTKLALAGLPIREGSSGKRSLAGKRRRGNGLPPSPSHWRATEGASAMRTGKGQSLPR
jgi:hypothetical protein